MELVPSGGASFFYPFEDLVYSGVVFGSFELDDMYLHFLACPDDSLEQSFDGFHMPPPAAIIMQVGRFFKRFSLFDILEHGFR